MDRFFYLIAATLVGIIRSMPLVLCFRVGEIVGLVVYTLLPHYRKLSRQNLRIAFGNTLSQRELGTLVRKNFQMLGANIICSVKIPAMSEEAIRALFTIENEEEWRHSIDRHDGRGTVVALSHFGNWELSAQIATFIKPRPAGAVYQALRNKALDNLVNKDRRTRGIATFDRKRDLSAAIALLREGGVLGILIDQHAGDAGIWIPFFNKLASTSPLAATLAQRTGSLLVQVTVRTVGCARWSLRIYPPTPTEGRGVAEIMYDLGTQLGEEIKRYPADWFWVHNRWKTPRPAFLLSRVKRGYYVPEKAQLQPFQLLVRSPNWLGDACMSAPAVCSLKEGRPDLHLTILTPEKLAPFWKTFSQVDEVIAIPAKSNPWQVACSLRQRNKKEHSSFFDAALLLPHSVRSALEVALAGVPRRIGRIGKNGVLRKMLLHQVIPNSFSSSAAGPLHQAEDCQAIAFWLGASAVKKEEQKKTATHHSAAPFRVGLCPGAEYGPAKRWPLERFREVMKQLRDIHWVLLGTAAEAPLGEKLLEGFSENVENKIGKTSLAELIAVIQSLDLLLTNDTGTMHLAALFNIPTVALFGSTDPSLTGPQGPGHRILRHQVECSPCFLRKCPIDFRCMHGISPEEVAQVLREQLAALSS
ncbi:MAG: lipopolysaccharide heptosyltransferase II [Chthoniobacterales bacterium]|nr:lipopolysaccharide heptosyltransferase II [Chthoniobacterales bacterium]